MLAGLTGCGDRARPATDPPIATYPIAIERAEFPSRQRLAVAVAFVLSVRNAGEQTIPNLAVTLRGFDDRRGRELWLVDRPPPGTTTAIDDTWAAGALAPGATKTLRWKVTPVSAGTHVLSYAIAPGLSGAGRTLLRGGGEARRRLTARVSDRPADARVDPRSGRVLRE